MDIHSISEFANQPTSLDFVNLLFGCLHQYLHLFLHSSMLAYANACHCDSWPHICSQSMHGVCTLLAECMHAAHICIELCAVRLVGHNLTFD